MAATPSNVRPPSTVAGLLSQWYGSRLRTRRVINDFNVTTTPTRICVADSSRVLLAISNNGGFGLVFGENRNITNSTGIQLSQAQTVTFEWWSDLDLQTTEIWALSLTGTVAVHVIESLLVGEYEVTADADQTA